jgi:hypothetical protein
MPHLYLQVKSTVKDKTNHAKWLNVFKNSYEENITKLHKQIEEGKVSIVDQFVPPKAMHILAEGLEVRMMDIPPMLGFEFDPSFM